MSSKIKFTGVTKVYTDGKKENKALDKINIEIGESKIVGLLGPNGAGKSTLLNIISGRILQNHGEIHIGEYLLAHKENNNIVCMMNDYEVSFDNYKIKTVLELASHHYKYYDHTYESELLDILKVDLNQKYSKTSKGQRGKVSLVIALASKAPITILDETFVSLDAPTRKIVFDLIIDEYTDNPRTFIISTHYINEISNMLEDVIILKDGQVILSQSKDDIENMSFSISGNYEKGISLLEGKNILKTNKFGKMAQFEVYDVLDENIKTALINYEFDVTVSSLQDFFLSAVSEEAGLC